MKSYYQNVINTFNNKISKIVAEKDDLDITFDNSKDFTRNRKLELSDLMKSIVFMAGKPIKEELYDYFDYSVDTASASAFVQQRSKLKAEAFEILLSRLNKSYPCNKKYLGYYLIAVDGSDLCIPYNEKDKETYINCKKQKGYNILHINTAYDILNHRYVDAIIKGKNNPAEQFSMYTMAERFNDKAIFIADRNYATWNNMEHIIKAGQKFLIRCKDIKSRTSLLNKFNLPDTEFDLDISTILTVKSTNEIKAHPEIYRFLSNASTFDFVDKDHPFYEVNYRAVRIKINGKEEYESIITNLDRDIFTASIIKKLYNMRWGIEISFRHLKYSTDLSSLHSRKRNSINQEIWARMILYNISMIMIEEAVKHSNMKKKKHEYYVNITRCIHLIRDLAKRKGGVPPNLEKLILKELLPIRPNRINTRNIKNQSVVCFNYRFS